MNPSITATRPLVKAILIIVGIAALAVSPAQADTPAGKYGQLDSWAYNAIQSNARATTFVTDHSAGQNGTGRPSVAADGQLDPWAYKLVHHASVPLVSEHSAGQNGTGRRSAAGSTLEAVYAQPGSPSGFRWRDAGVGAAGTLGLVLLAAGVVLTLRARSLTHAHA